jgi:signal transduction histidine kinase
MRRFNRLNSTSLSPWKVYGGAWQVGNSLVRNNSDDRGTKLLAGSSAWRDYTLTSELHFDGDHGDMGVIVRADHAEEGVDSYDGYYVGLRTTDGTLVVGRSDFGWIETQPIPMPGGVHANTWYRIAVTVVGCHLAASSENLSTGQRAYAALQDDDCLPRGQIGLRSLATGGMWRNVSVTPATLGDYQGRAQSAGRLRTLELPKREADYNRGFQFSLSDPKSLSTARETAGPETQIEHIADLNQLPHGSQEPVRLHGVVTLASPALYVQDADGAVLVKGTTRMQLNAGDAVEVVGVAEPGVYSSVIRNSTVRLLWSGTPLPPVAVTPAQAASGAYDAKYVETEARLVSQSEDAKGNVVLEFADNSQSFRAVLNAQMAQSMPRIERNSLMRVRGVCVLDREVTQDATPFVLLPRSADDVQILAAAPWWTPWHVGLLSVCVIALIMLAQMGYYRVHQWRASAVTKERERLAHEIHDTMAQSFAGVGYQIQGIRNRVLKNERMEQEQIADQLGVAYQLVRRCHEEASRTIAMLGNPSPEVQNNLLGMLSATARRIAGASMDVIATVDGDVYPLHLRCANAMLMIGQEAIANALGHGGATRLELKLGRKEQRVELSIRDNGKGFDAHPQSAGFGIQGMQKRARDIGGKLEIQSADGEGTTVRVIAWMRRESGLEAFGVKWAELRHRIRSFFIDAEV